MTKPTEEEFTRMRRCIMAALPGFKFQIFMLDTRVKVYLMSGPLPAPVPEIGLIDDERGFKRDLSEHPEFKELFELIRRIVLAIKPRKDRIDLKHGPRDYFIELGLGGRNGFPYWQRLPGQSRLGPSRPGPSLT